MAWTYDPNGVLNNPRDQVRLAVGDTLASDPQLQDAEVDLLLQQMPNVNLAAVQAAVTLQARYSRNADKTTGTLSVSASQRAKAYADLAGRLRRRAYAGSCNIMVGGRLVAERLAARHNPALIRPLFEVGQWDAPGVPDEAWVGGGYGFIAGGSWPWTCF